MNGRGKSDRPIGPAKRRNRYIGSLLLAEVVEARCLAGENLQRQNTHRVQSRGRTHSTPERVWQVVASGSRAGAQCGSPARWNLYGGQPLRLIPTVMKTWFRI